MIIPERKNDRQGTRGDHRKKCCSLREKLIVAEGCIERDVEDRQTPSAKAMRKNPLVAPAQPVGNANQNESTQQAENNPARCTDPLVISRILEEKDDADSERDCADAIDNCESKLRFKLLGRGLVWKRLSGLRRWRGCEVPPSFKGDHPLLELSYLL